MHVFVTGATGFIGSAIVPELVGAGHEVTGLARSEESAAKLAAAGAKALRGTLADHDTLRQGSRAADGVIHTAFIHDFSNLVAAAETDRAAIMAMLGALAGSGKPFVSTSGTLLIASGRVGTEEDRGRPEAPGSYRIAAEELVLAAAADGVRSCVIRLPPSVHGEGDRAFVPALFDAARRAGFSAHIGEGTNVWPAVHRLDAARLYRLALESAPAGSMLHGVADEGFEVRHIAAAIGDRLGQGAARSVPAEQAEAHFGWLAYFLAGHNPVSSARTRALLGWQPTQPDLLADIRSHAYPA